MKIIIFSESDYNFVAKLTKICNLHEDELVFLEDLKKLNQIESNALVLIDYCDYKNSVNNIFDNVIKRESMTYCILVDKMKSEIHKNLTNLGFDITMTKNLFLMNFKIIKTQCISS